MAEKQRQEDYISLEKAEEKAFFDHLKQGIYKELYQRECLTLAQLKQLQNIA